MVGSLMVTKFDRRLPENGLKLLEAAPVWWTDLLAARFKDACGKEQPLFLAVRDGYLNAYREGQSILKIVFDLMAKITRLTAEIHNKYVYDDDQSYLKFDGNEVKAKQYQSVPYERGKSADEWVKRARHYAVAEKKGVAVIVARNNHVIDVEMALTGQTSTHRIDIVALEQDGKGFKIVFYEAKRFDNPDLRAKNLRPNVLDQLERYERWLSHEGRPKEVVDAYREACRLLIKLNDMRDPATKQPTHDFIVQVAAGANLEADTKPRLIIFGYEPAQLTASWPIHDNALWDAGIRGARLIMEPRPEDVQLPGPTPPTLAVDEAKDVLMTVEGPAPVKQARAAVRRVKPDLQAKLQGLAHFAPIFTAPGFKFAAWRREPPDESGILHLPESELSRDADEFVKAAYDLGWVKQFDWSAWMGTPEGRRLIESPDLVASATHDQLAKLLTVYIRGERFNEGALNSAFESGLLTAIVRRAEALLLALSP